MKNRPRLIASAVVCLLLACSDVVPIGEGLGGDGDGQPGPERPGENTPSSSPSSSSPESAPSPAECSAPSAVPAPANRCGAYKGVPIYGCDMPGQSLLGGDQYGIYTYASVEQSTGGNLHTIARLKPDSTFETVHTFWRVWKNEQIAFVSGEFFIANKDTNSIDVVKPGAGTATTTRSISLSVPGFKLHSFYPYDCHRLVASMEKSEEGARESGLYLFEEGQAPKLVMKTFQLPIALGKDHLYYNDADNRIYRVPLAGGSPETVYTGPPNAEVAGIARAFVVGDDLFVAQQVKVAIPGNILQPEATEVRLFKQPLGVLGGSTARSISLGWGGSSDHQFAVTDKAIYYVYGKDNSNASQPPKTHERNTLYRVPFDLSSTTPILDYSSLAPRSGFASEASNMGPTIAGDRLYFGSWDSFDYYHTGKTGRVLAYTLP